MTEAYKNSVAGSYQKMLFCLATYGPMCINLSDYKQRDKKNPNSNDERQIAQPSDAF